MPLPDWRCNKIWAKTGVWLQMKISSSVSGIEKSLDCWAINMWTLIYTKPESDYLIRDNARVGRAGEIMTDFLMWHQHYSGSSGVSRAHCTTYTPGIIIFHPQHFQIIIPNIVNLTFLKMDTKDITVFSVSQKTAGGGRRSGTNSVRLFNKTGVNTISKPNHIERVGSESNQGFSNQ